jgi:hypothetical protein
MLKFLPKILNKSFPISNGGKIYGNFPSTTRGLQQNKFFYLYDNTGDYSSVNPFGYNFPNPSKADISVLDLYTYLPIEKKYLTPTPPSQTEYNILSTSFLADSIQPIEYYQLIGDSSASVTEYPNNLYLFMIEGTAGTQDIYYAQLALQASEIVCELQRLTDKILYEKACCDTIKKYDMLNLTFQALMYEIDCVNNYLSTIEYSENYQQEIIKSSIYVNANNLFKKAKALVNKKGGCGCGCN